MSAESVGLPWTDLRDHAAALGLASQFRWVKVGGTYIVRLAWDVLVMEARFEASSSDGTDFEDNYRANIESGVTQAGLSLMTVSATPESATTFIKSWLYTGLPNVTTIIDQRADGLTGAKGIMYLAGGEYRVIGAATKGSSLAFAVVDRDDTLGLFSTYGLTRTRLTALTGIVGTFQVGEVVTGAGGASGTILAVGSDYLEIRFDFTGAWADGEVLTGATSGATANLGTYAEGSVLVLSEYVEDEWVFTDEQRRIAPGSVKKVIKGLYMRTSIYNADTTTDLEIKVTLTMAKE